MKTNWNLLLWLAILATCAGFMVAIKMQEQADQEQQAGAEE